MKGRFYKPSLEHSTPESAFSNGYSKPWSETTKYPSVYIWKTSIPNSLIKLKGDKAFQHISETGRNKNTLEFLKNSHKYLNIIADSHRHTPSMRESLNNSRAETPVLSPRSREKEDYKAKPVLNLEINSPKSVYTENYTHQSGEENAGFQFTKEIKIPHTTKNKINILSFEPQLPEVKKENYLVNSSSLPKLLSRSQKKVENTGVGFKNKDIEAFIQRFNKKTSELPSPKFRIGTNGWKLVNLKKKEKNCIAN